MDPEIKKSLNDKRQYRYIILENGLKALLVSDFSTYQENEIRDESDDSEDEDGNSSDDEAHSDDDENDSDDNASDASEPSGKKNNVGVKMAAAALCVGMGSFSDPDNIPGLAHFLEHMVFMGSEKYPNENDFDAFLRMHGGSSNAYTDVERTVFYFDVQRKYFHDALDMFAQFFVASLLKKDSVDREVEAVDSEFEMSKPSDVNRKQQLLGSFSKPGHPMGKFFWGSTNTLKKYPTDNGIDVYGQLRDFYTRMYSSHYMTLAVQSRESLDQLEAWVKEIFIEIPNNGQPKPDFTHYKDTFDTPEFYRLYKVIPVKKMHELEITWSLPCLLEHYRVKPLHYIGWLIGHEGNGSLMSYLKKRFWALSVLSGNSESGWENNSTWATFTVTVTLTVEGFNNINNVLLAIFGYIKMLKREGPQERIYNEIKTIEDNDFRWQEQVDPVDYVERLCENMQRFPKNECLCADVLLFSYDKKVIDDCTQMLKPEAMNVMILSEFHEKIANCTESEKWYETPYEVQDFDTELIKSLQDAEPSEEFYFPTENTYIATEFGLKEPDIAETTMPVIISDTPLSRLWYKKDFKFKVPKAYIYFHLISPISYKTPLYAVLLELYMGVLRLNLSEVAYAADVAQLTYSFKVLETGLAISMSGFDHKIPQLFTTIMDHLVDFTCDNKMFDAVKDQLKRKFHNNFIKSQNLNRDVRLSIIQDVYWSNLDKYNAICHVTMDGLLSYIQEFKTVLFVEGLVQGNMTTKEAQALETYLLKKLNCTSIPKNLLQEIRVAVLPEGCRCCRVRSLLPDDSNCVVTNYYQVGPVTGLRDFVINELLNSIMEEPCYNVLRTREQLGYAVFCTNRNTFNVLGYSVTVESQSSKFSMEVLDEKIEMFLQEFKEMLEKMEPTEFEERKSGLINIKKCEDSSLSEEVDRNCGEIVRQRYIFDLLPREIEELEKLEKCAVIDWYTKYITGSKVKKMSCQVEASGDKATSAELNAPKFPERPKGHISPKLLRRNSASRQKNIRNEAIEFEPNINLSEHFDLTFLQINSANTGQIITDIVDFKQKCFLYPITKLHV